MSPPSGVWTGVLVLTQTSAFIKKTAACTGRGGVLVVQHTVMYDHIEEPSSSRPWSLPNGPKWTLMESKCQRPGFLVVVVVAVVVVLVTGFPIVQTTFRGFLCLICGLSELLHLYFHTMRLLRRWVVKGCWQNMGLGVGCKTQKKYHHGWVWHGVPSCLCNTAQHHHFTPVCQWDEVVWSYLWFLST